MDISAEAHRLQNMRFGPPYDYGRDFRDVPVLLAGPAAIAKQRLRQVIAADRKGVPTGRWVRRLDPVAFNLFRAAMLFGLPTWSAFLSGRDTGKPRYRWERRQ